MKLALVLFCAFAALLAACARVTQTPDEVAIAFFKRANDSNYGGALALHTPQARQRIEQAAGVAGMTVDESFRSLTQNGTITGMTAAPYTITGDTASVTVNLKYRNGTSGGMTVKLQRQSNGSWVIL